MTTRLLLTMLLLSATGCTYQRTVRPADVDSVVDLNRRAGQHNVTVTLANGAVHHGRALQMATDSTSWLIEGTPGVKSVATADVVAVEIQVRGRGVLEGLAMGVVAGGTAGAALGLMAGDDPPCDGGLCLFQMTAGDKALFSGLILGTVSGLGGLILGAVIGSKDEYQVETLGAADHLSQD